MKTRPLAVAAAGLALLMLAATGCMPADITAAPNSPEAPPTASEPTSTEAVQAGKQLFAQNCQRCHVTGMAGAPDLTGLTDRLSRQQFDHTVENGRRMMPAWPQLSDGERGQLWAFLSTATASNKLVAQTEGSGGGCGCGGGRKAKRAAADNRPDEGSSCAGGSSCGSGCCGSH